MSDAFLIELPFQTYERVLGRPWPGGRSAEVRELLRQYGIAYQPGSDVANLTLQECLVWNSPKSAETRF
jgi:hypothetical protein